MKSPKRKKKSKPSGLRKYWPHLTLKECVIERDKMYAEQDNKCAICKKPKDVEGRHLAIDHNHKNGRVRGLLCFYCNKYRVGRHTIESARLILDYLLKYDLPLGDK